MSLPRPGMSLWSTFTSSAGFVFNTTRGILRWTESAAPWPLSIVPRTLRLPLDVAAMFAPPGDAEAMARARRDTGASTRGDAPNARDVAGARTSSQGQSYDDGAPPPAERTATIAGTRSEGDDDAPRFDREVRARLAPLYTRASGRGLPTLVLLHAFPLSSRMWEPQLESLSRRFRVVAPDLAGFGLSWTPDAPFSLIDQAHAVETTLDDLRIDEMVVVGCSMGGYVALPLLDRLGPRVRGLVLANTRATPDTEAAAADRHRLATEVESEGVDAVVSEMTAKLLGTSTLRDRPDLVDHVQALMLENGPAGIAIALRAMAARPGSSALLRRVHCPVLVIAGEEDTVNGPDVARAMAAKIRAARVEVLPGGHLSNLEATEEFDRELADFARTLHEIPSAPPARRRAAHG